MMTSWLNPTLQDLPVEFPIFPLPGALLLPHGRLPLNVFEPRYLAMVEDSLAAGRVFGMIQPNAHAPRAPTGPSLYQIGCLGRLTQFAETSDGRFLITLTGVSRFRVNDELPIRRGYRRVQADFTPFVRDLEPPHERTALRRPEFLGALKPYFKVHGIDANWDAIDEMPDSMLVTTLAMLCPFDDAEKQALLEAPTEQDRAADLLALLRMAVHEADPNARPS
jgi:Lon protease-like protein